MALFHPWARLDSYVEGVLPPATRERISAHLSRCDACRREAEQRERILQAASSLPNPSGPQSTVQNPVTPLLQDREGVAGWKVVAGLGALGLVAVGMLSSAWMAGDPENMAGPDQGETYLLPTHGQSPSPLGAGAGSAPGADTSPDEGADASSAAGSLFGAGSGDTRSDSAGLAPAGRGLPTAGTASRLPSATGSDSGVTDSAGASLGNDVELTPAMVTDLRRLGWNIPMLDGLGMATQSTGWQQGAQVAEVVMSLRDEQFTLVLHECRSLTGESDMPGCPVRTAGEGPDTLAGPVGGGEIGSDRLGARELPGGVDMTVAEHGDGSWTATARTAHAAYAVDSDLPVESASRVMTLVVISERSRVQAGTAPERPSERLARGFERLLPWTEQPGAKAQ